MNVIAHILLVLGVVGNIRYGAEVLLVLVLWTWILTVVVIWPLVTSIMLSRDVELPSGRSVSLLRQCQFCYRRSLLKATAQSVTSR